MMRQEKYTAAVAMSGIATRRRIVRLSAALDGTSAPAMTAAIYRGPSIRSSSSTSPATIAADHRLSSSDSVSTVSPSAKGAVSSDAQLHTASGPARTTTRVPATAAGAE